MQLQSNLCENYKELLKSLTFLHPDFESKVLQSDYDDNFDILLAVYLKFTLNALSLNQISEQDLKPL
jgi:hypothetical protein